ncbi:MAG: hypothetical protein AAB953_01890, partial [Patescibacteria group bacterium]
NVPSNSPEPSKLDVLNGLFNQALKAMKDAVGARQKIDPSKDLVTLDDKAKESFEAPKVAFEKKFDLGDYQITPKDLKDVKIKAKHAYLLVGSVDQVAFTKGAKRETKWYQALHQDAKLFLKVKDRVEIKFPGLKDTAKNTKMMDIIDKISKMTDFTDAAWNKMIADNKYTDDEIYGAEGAYNLLLAFQRAIGSVDRKALLDPPKITLDATDPNNPISVPQLAKIRLELSSKNGKADEDRVSRLVGVKVKEAKKETVVEAPKTDPDYTYELSGDQKKLTLSRTVKGNKYSTEYPIDNQDGLELTIQTNKDDANDKWVEIEDAQKEGFSFEFNTDDSSSLVAFNSTPKNQYNVRIKAGTIVIKKKE